jgi:hypothetical protein
VHEQKYLIGRFLLRLGQIVIGVLDRRGDVSRQTIEVGFARRMVNDRSVTRLRTSFVSRATAGPIQGARVVDEKGDYRNCDRYADQQINETVRKRSLAAVNLPKSDNNGGGNCQGNGYAANSFHINPSGSKALAGDQPPKQ